MTVEDMMVHRMRQSWNVLIRCIYSRNCHYIFVYKNRQIIVQK